MKFGYDMKRILISALTALAVLTGSAFTATADEGMWLLPLLEKMNAKDLKKHGCKLSPKQIYNGDGVSLKDAIVQFGGGCTGEIISDEGLLVTNHHCGYSYIQALSSVEHNYLQDGFWAMKRSEELPCEGLAVTFLEAVTDVTDIISATEADARVRLRNSIDVESAVAKAVAEKKAELVKAADEEHANCNSEVVSYYNDNLFYLVTYKIYRDVRFVGAPPSSVGKFGADTDNWMWPRHTCDFSMFRVYAGADNEPADYSADNQPLRPKNHLKISLKGVKEGDFTMIMGYPGRTNRFATSAELKEMLAENDIRIAARTLRQDLMMEDMLADPKVKIQYASKYSGSSNGWKKWKGMKLAFEKLDVIGRTEAEEQAFREWVGADAARTEKYGDALDGIAAAVDGASEASLFSTLLIETVYRCEIGNAAAAAFGAYLSTMKESSDSTLALGAALDELYGFYKDYSLPTDRKITEALLRFYHQNTESGNWIIPDFNEATLKAYVDTLFTHSVFTSEEKASEALKEAVETENGMTALREDPAFKLYQEFVTRYFGNNKNISDFRSKAVEGKKAYTAGLLEWKAGQPSYPDANFTMRLTYGNVMGYSPADAVEYDYYTTLAGVMEKEDPDNWEFVVPAKLKELYQTGDFGQYAMKDGRMPACFLSNNDITGGNSGSPVLNAKGELIGLAFDGNWESMSSDIMFEPNLQRCINVDIRYVLFIVDKLGGAGYLLDEMDIR